MNDYRLLPQASPETLEAIVLRHLPRQALQGLAEYFVRHQTGQILLNVNHGEIQSFELKEHHRIQRD